MPIMYDTENGGQKKNRPVSANHVEAKTDRRRRQRGRAGVNAQPQQPAMGPLNIIEEGRNASTAEQPAEAAASTLDDGTLLAGASAPTVAQGPTLHPSSRTRITKSIPAKQFHEVSAAMRATRSSERLANKQATTEEKLRLAKEARKRGRRAAKAERNAKVAYNQGVITADAIVQAATEAAAATVDRLKQQLQAAKAARTQARQEVLFSQLSYPGADVEHSEDDGSNEDGSGDNVSDKDGSDGSGLDDDGSDLSE
ncbi:MAG: hypothetical protein Q9169_007421 [Polycauliona sp. 2 TL-2023]